MEMKDLEPMFITISFPPMRLEVNYIESRKNESIETRLHFMDRRRRTEEKGREEKMCIPRTFDSEAN